MLSVRVATGLRLSRRYFAAAKPPTEALHQEVEHHDEHHHHEYQAPKDFFAGGGARRVGGFGYGIMAEWTGTGYSWSKGPLTGLPYYPTMGGVPDKFIKIDANNHLACADYYSKVGFFGMVKYTMMSTFFRTTVALRNLAVFAAIVSIIFYNRRWEPLETTMDRETFFRDFEANYYGAFYNHHAFAERLARRRAKKWGYEDQVEIPHAHH